MNSSQLGLTLIKAQVNLLKILILRIENADSNYSWEDNIFFDFLFAWAEHQFTGTRFG
tara:strand:+ start:3670 stop:3843 length:174 start_codon:yes stop_codon:yes gene_type:complete